MHNSESVPGNETHKIIWYFQIQTEHLIPARRLDLVIITRKRDLAELWTLLPPADHRVKLKESEKKDKYPDLARELKKPMNMKVTMIPIIIGALGTVT